MFVVTATVAYVTGPLENTKIEDAQTLDFHGKNLGQVLNRFDTHMRAFALLQETPKFRLVQGDLSLYTEASAKTHDKNHNA